MNPVHDILLRSKLPWDVCRIIKSFVGPRIHIPIEPDYTLMSIEELVKFRKRHKGRSFTW